MTCGREKAQQLADDLEEERSREKTDAWLLMHKPKQTVIATAEGHVLMTVEPHVKAPGYQGLTTQTPPNGEPNPRGDVTCLSSSHQKAIKDLLLMFNQMKRGHTAETLEAVRVCRMLMDS